MTDNNVFDGEATLAPTPEATLETPPDPAEAPPQAALDANPTEAQPEAAPQVVPAAEPEASQIVAEATDDAPTEEPQPEAAPAAETPREFLNIDLKPKLELKGKVKRIELFGAFIDLGIEREGLVHISQIQEAPVKNVRDHFQEGDEVTVWVRRFEPNSNAPVELTMIQPLGLQWNEITTGMVVTGTVVRLEKFGAFLDIGAERPGMVHVSEMGSAYVTSPEEELTVGNTVEAKVIKVNSRKKQIDLSIKALQAPVMAAAREQNDDDDKIPTAFELALRRAMQSSDGEYPELQAAINNAERDAKNGKKDKNKRDKRDKKQSEDKRRQQQEELLSRTLKTREGAR
jgi:predicted RNA-binding protein with RPS1 domain